ncbi:MAG TPA: regulatory protein RecX [Desulfuromonadaceae bacterium]
MRSRSSEPSSAEGAYRYAVRLLAARDYTSLKLQRKLLDREFSETDSESAVMRLLAEGWLNDRRFAERFAEAAQASGRFFGPRLRLEMRRRGIPAELINEVVGRIGGEHDEEEGLRSLLERRFPGFSFAAATDRERRRVIGFLQRRGFSSGAIRGVMRE